MAALSPSQQAYQMAHFNEDLGPLVIRTSIALAVLITIVTTLRSIARHVLRLPLGWDDFFCICGMTLIDCMCAMNVISVRYGMGKHVWVADPTQAWKILKVGFYLAIDYCLAHFTIKMALLFTYIRFFGRFNRAFKYAVWAVMFYVTAWAVTGIIAASTQCRPLSYFWTQLDFDRVPPAQGHCPVHNVPLVISLSALNLAGDFMILILPLPMVWGLQMPRTRKISLCSLFLVGVFGCVAGILRLTSTLNSVTVGSDTTWNAAIVYMWTIIEATVQLFCACVFIIWPFIIKLGKQVHSLMSNSSNLDSQERLAAKLPTVRSDLDTPGTSVAEKSSAEVFASQPRSSSAVTASAGPGDVATIEQGRIVKQVGYSVEVLNHSTH